MSDHPADPTTTDDSSNSPSAGEYPDGNGPGHEGGEASGCDENAGKRALLSERSTPTILVVDDTRFSLQLLVRILASQQYYVRPLSDGEEAIATALENPPDLVLLDIMMPGIDGYEVCRRLKADERTRHIPVLFISSLSETFDKVRAFSVGGVDYVSKPFQADEILARVKTHLSLREMQRTLQEQNALLRKEIAERTRAQAILRQQNHKLAVLNKQLVSAQKSLKEANEELREALGKVRKLSGLLPICAQCKKIRDDKGYWRQLETYIRDHSEADFSHSICADCARVLYPDLDLSSLK